MITSKKQLSKEKKTGIKVLSLNNDRIAISLPCSCLEDIFTNLVPFFCCSWSDEMNPPQVIRTLLPLLLESSTESVAEISSNSLERILGPAESDEFLARVYEKLITGCYNILANHADPNRWAWLRIVRFLWPAAATNEVGQHWLLYVIYKELLLVLLNRKFCTCVHFIFLWTWMKGYSESSLMVNS